ncbi:ethylene-responsive transcription factor erf017 [Phtheirospermum japonicum]|uniref:Ethylene-responsive transcription factor erf017 n=1 Tax=Phtheirospermum japonicum TaxID=374723 RepID=A0A830CFU6_9LAMI|nr:ethylene-responsive transcription factor erf017 [Phtheirospermum japonicum]
MSLRYASPTAGSGYGSARTTPRRRRLGLSTPPCSASAGLTPSSTSPKIPRESQAARG